MFGDGYSKTSIHHNFQASIQNIHHHNFQASNSRPPPKMPPSFRKEGSLIKGACEAHHHPHIIPCSNKASPLDSHDNHPTVPTVMGRSLVSQQTITWFLWPVKGFWDFLLVGVGKATRGLGENPQMAVVNSKGIYRPKCSN